jgi:hypothetical protein
MQKITIPVLALFVLILCAGCKSVDYNPTYTRPLTSGILPRYQGKLLIYTTPSDDDFVFHGHPKSVTGIAWKLKVPLGKMSKKMAGDIYGRSFGAGYEFGGALDINNNGFVVILHPQIEDFAWRMNQAKNLGFAITPQVKMTLSLQLLSADKKAVIFQRQYESGWVDGNSYVISVTPFEAINSLIHKTMANLMVDSIRDLDTAMHPNLPQTQPLPESFSMRDEGIENSLYFWSVWSSEMAAIGRQQGQLRSSTYRPNLMNQSRQSVFTDSRFIETNISGNFEGWTGNTVWAMDNDQVWQQAQYSNHYHYAYHPKVIVFPSNGTWFMRVDGDDDQVQVQRIK